MHLKPYYIFVNQPIPIFNSIWKYLLYMPLFCMQKKMHRKDLKRILSCDRTTYFMLKSCDREKCFMMNMNISNECSIYVCKMWHCHCRHQYVQPLGADEPIFVIYVFWASTASRHYFTQLRDSNFHLYQIHQDWIQ